MNSKLSNCLIHAFYFWLITPKSKIKGYYNKRYKTISFYVVVDNTYTIKFSRDRSKIKISKFLFYVNTSFKQLK